MSEFQSGFKTGKFSKIGELRGQEAVESGELWVGLRVDLPLSKLVSGMEHISLEIAMNVHVDQESSKQSMPI